MRGLTKKVLSFAFLTCVLLMTVSCEEFTSFVDNPVGSYLKIETESLSMTPGDSYQIQASTISTGPITYESSDDLVATVDSKGMVKATGDGEAVITVKVAANDVYAAGSTNLKVTVSRTDLQAPLTLLAKADGVITVTVSNAELKEPVYYNILRKTKGAVKATMDIPVKQGDKVEFSSRNKTLATAVSKYVNIKPQMECSVYGNAMSLIAPDSSWVDNTEITGEFALAGLFHGASNIVNDDTRKLLLPATTLTVDCYSYMFGDCISLTEAPELPAEEMAANCYQYMFGGCSSLAEAPKLPATKLAKSCYSDMFNGCTSLTEAPELPATTLADNCYYNMFSSCTSLTKAPDLPAPSLTAYCYAFMFYDCSKLSSVKCLATTGAKYALMNWLKKAGTDSSVTGLQFVRAAGNTNWVTNNNTALTATQWYVPTAWTIVSE